MVDAKQTSAQLCGCAHGESIPQRLPGFTGRQAEALHNNSLSDQPERVRVRFLQKPGANALRLILNPVTYCCAA
ncbi:MAG: hypothetical protein KDA96_25290, partial [Planctomycetaceae bacterium]|nr:hypothetical protein [Planctomycetaceae bacterium]